MSRISHIFFVNFRDISVENSLYNVTVTVKTSVQTHI
jgi:hypothetical protein